MKVLKRIFIISLSAIIISLNICVFALKPIEIRANEIENNVESGAAAIPYIAELIYSLLMTAGVAVGAYELMDNAQTQKDIYRDFIQKVGDGNITIPDVGGEVFIPDADTVSGWLKFPVSKDLFSHEEWQEIRGWTPPTPEQPPEDPEKPPRDEDYWQQLGKQSSFKVNGSMLSAVVNYFELLFEEDTLLSQTVFGNPKSSGYNGEAPLINGFYEYEGSTTGNVSMNGRNFYRHSVFNSKSQSKFAGSLNSSNGILSCHTYNNVLGTLFASPLNGYKYQDSYSKTPTLIDRWLTNSNQWSSSYEADVSLEVNFPVFNNKTDVLIYFQTGVIEGCINLDPKVDYQVGINRLTDTLRPLVGAQVSTQALIDTMKKTKTAIKERPEVETEPYIDTFKKTLDETIKVTPVPKPDFKPTLPPTYPEIGTDIPSDKKDTLRDWSKIFPFCIPFDLVDLIRILEAEPKAPRFEWLFKIDMLNFEHLIILDLSIFDEVAKVVRMCELILFIVGLGFTTKAVAKW